MRLLEKSKELTKWLIIFLCLLGALFFVNGKRVEEYNTLLAKAHRYYDDKTESEYAFLVYSNEICKEFPLWFFLTPVNGLAVVYTGFRTYKEYKKVSHFISEQAALEEEKEK